MSRKFALINRKKYEVTYDFNMVANWVFTDKDGKQYLVDGEDVTVWSKDQGFKWDGVNTAIAYAKYYIQESGNGIFWWKVKGE